MDYGTYVVTSHQAWATCNQNIYGWTYTILYIINHDNNRCFQFVREAPERAKKKKKNEGFWNRWFGDSDSEDEYEIQEAKRTSKSSDDFA
jgi:hypothetical protein